jgi:hypothetical protein
VIFGSVGFAAAQRAPGDVHADLTANQQHVVSQGLATSPSQPARSRRSAARFRIP